MLGLHGCVGFSLAVVLGGHSLAVERGGYSLVVIHRLLIAVASLVVEHGF